jgi:endoglucanase
MRGVSPSGKPGKVRQWTSAAVAGVFIGLLAALLAFGLGTGDVTGIALARETVAPAAPSPAQCTGPSYPSTRDPANPLLTTPAPPPSDPLRGANLLVLGPEHGVAAGAIAQLLGMDTNVTLGSPLTAFPDTESYAGFRASISAQLAEEPASVQRDVGLLEKIAQEPSALRISAYTASGTPAGIYASARGLFCDTTMSDPGSVPLISTYFLHATLGGCASTAQIDAYAPRFKAQIDAMAQGIADNPAVIVAEEDAVGSSSCMAKRRSLPAWEALMRYEDLTLEALPHTAVYMEGGYSDANTAAYAAKMLNAAGISRIQGFFTNDTHLQWTSHELKYAAAVSKLTGGAHFIINTAGNGRGPLLNPHPRTQGIEDLCNPPNRGLGIPDTTDPGLDPDLDALLWTAPPGNSSGTCNGGPPSGTFWVARAEGLAANANAQLGPGYPSKPY